MAYSAITSGEIDTDSPITTGLMNKYNDNIEAMRDGTGIQDDKILNRHIATDAVNQDSIAAGSVHQGELDVSVESLSSSSSLATLTTSAGNYALSVKTGVGNGQVYEGASGAGGALSILHRVLFTITTNTGYADIAYINASPPYDLGDGEIPIFVWLLMNGSTIEAISTSETPTWAYNGPTNITPDRVAKINGELKKFKNVRSVDEETGEISIVETEITMEMKNADMNLLPHPFIDNDLTGKQVILLDPVETLYLKEFHLAGESVNELLHKDYLRLNNSPIVRAVPNGVIPSRFQWKNTQSRAGAMLKDRRLKQGHYSNTGA